MKLLPGFSIGLILALALLPVHAQVNSGSDGHDGAFNPTTNTVINMADHPDGIYHYTSVNIPAGVTVSFLPNANNSPVVWLVQSDCVIEGVVNVNGQNSSGANGGLGGSGGYRGGSGVNPPTFGQGPSGGAVGEDGSFSSGNSFLIPLFGGSGGGGNYWAYERAPMGGGGGGGAILIAASNLVRLNGGISANGGVGISYALYSNGNYIGSISSGSGSGGAVRILSLVFTGNGYVSVSRGRVRIDTFENTFAGNLPTGTSHGFQPIVIPAAGQGVQLAIASVAGNSVPANPSSTLANPAVIIPGQQANPIPIVVHCSNIPLNTPITVTVKPVNGPAVSATANNTAGTAASSTATVNINMPRGGGIIYATTVVGISGQQASLSAPEKNARMAESGGAHAPRVLFDAPSRRTSERVEKSDALDESTRSTPTTGASLAAREARAVPEMKTPALRDLPLSVTGWTASGERFAKMEITAALGGKQEVTYITESGKRYPLAAK